MIPRPDLSHRPHQLTVERNMAATPAQLYQAWTERFELWFAAPGTVRMRAEVDDPFFFETHFHGQRHPHYGRFLTLEPECRIELTWLTGAGGTNGAETVVTVELEPSESGTFLRLTHAGFADEDAARQHADAWPLVLNQLDERVTEQM